MKDLLTFILKEITKKDDFEIKEEVDGDFIRFTVLAPKEIMGIIIGREGRTIKSIRNLLKVRATLEKKAVSVSVEEKTS